MATYRRISGVYEILNTVNNKRYIGHSMSILKRWEGHKYHLRKGDSLHTHLQSAWNAYGENSFIFSIVEILPDGLSIGEYEIVETKWVEHFKTNLREFGYNAILPGGYVLTGEDENKTNLNRGHSNDTVCVCINLITEKKVELSGSKNISDTLGVPFNKISELTQYWKGKGKIKSRNNWLIILKEDYIEDFDYINFKKHRKCTLTEKKTWRDYEANRTSRKKSPENVIPHLERNLKRRSIVAVNVLTREEREYRMVKDCYAEFDKTKVGKCLRFPFGKYQHRGHYFRYNDV